MPENKRNKVLVTGASGRIGRHLVSALIEAGYAVRALTSKSALPENVSRSIEWRHHDWQESLDFLSHVEGCDAVLHLGAEIWDIPKMQRLNVEATQALARASEAAGIKFFGYTSSVAVYGSARFPLVTEASPTLTAEADVKSEYLANASLRAYGRTKLLGERKLQEEAQRIEYVIFRPTVVVDIPDLMKLAEWSGIRKAISGHRHTHHIYVKDVAAALIWFMERALSRKQHAGVETYTLSDEAGRQDSYTSFFRQVYTATGDKRFRLGMPAPLACYRLLDMLKNRLLTARHSLGSMIFSQEKLYSTGYRHPFGMQEARRMLVEKILTEKM